jgi:aldehyde dehydrogenase (NAD+)
VKAEPKGVCLIIAPWNYPVNLLLGPAVSAIAAGNTLIMKPSEITPHTAALMSKLINDNFDSDELCVVEGGVEETTELLSLPFDHIFFTGSTAVGKVVMKAASEHLTSVTLELGGKSPAIVDATADIKDAAEKIVWGKWVNNGQTCIAPDYVMVHESVKGQFLEEMKKCISNFFVPNGETFSNSPFYSRVVSDRHFKRLAAMIEDAINKGAVLAIGGQVDASERLIEPTVLENVSEDSTLLLEEIFGPILPVNSFQNIDAVIDKINNNQKPLALYIFSKSKEVITKVEGSTSSGSACINDCVLQFMQPNLPFGGVNHSGIGKAHGHYGFLEFSNQKSILKQRIGLTSAKSLYPPYTGAKQKMIDFMMKYV